MDAYSNNRLPPRRRFHQWFRPWPALSITLGGSRRLLRQCKKKNQYISQRWCYDRYVAGGGPYEVWSYYHTTSYKTDSKQTQEHGSRLLEDIASYYDVS